MEIAATAIPEGELVGARKCALRGVPTAFLLYRIDGRPVRGCIFGVDQLERFPDALDAPLMDETYDVKVAAIRSRLRVVGAAGGLPCDRLLSFCRVLTDPRR